MHPDRLHPHQPPHGFHGVPPPLPRPVLPEGRPWWKAMWVSALVSVALVVVGVVLVVIAATDNWDSRVNPDHEPLFLAGMILGVVGLMLGLVAVPTCWLIDMVKRAT